MKNRSTSALLAATLLLLAACSKDSVTPSTSTTPTPPSPTITRVGSTVMSGTLASIRMSYQYTIPQVNMTVPIEIESAVAAFVAGSGTALADAGAVSVNSHVLDKASNNAYVKAGNFSASSTAQDGTSLDFDNGSSWSVAGAGGITGFTYNHTINMPDYNGTLPTTITKTSGLTVALNTVSGADSVYVLLAAGDKQLLKRVRGGSASASFTAAELATLPTVTNNTALIEVVPFKYTVVTQGGKPYAFVKEYAAVGNVNIQ